MKRNFLLVLAGLLVLMSAACSKGYESQKNVGELNVTLKAERYPLIKGDNNLFVTVSDAAGNPVTDAAVEVRYYMPPMPGMAPMDFTTQAVLKGKSYAFVANPSMEGGWKVEPTVTRPGKETVTTVFNIDAR